MKIKDFKDKKVTIIGLGLHGGGVGAAKFFSRAKAKVLVTDLKTKDELAESIEKLKKEPIKYVLGQHRSEDFINADLIIQNPGVRDKSKYLEIARENNVPIETDIGIFFELCTVPIIGVTGSRGKSTTSVLIARFLKRRYSEVILAGNIRSSALLKLKKIDKDTKVVLELSSWQLAGLKSHKKSPAYAVLTNLMPDHLDRYKDMEQYIRDKRKIFRWQKSDNYLVLNYDDKQVREFSQEAKSKVFYFSQNNQSASDFQGSFVKDDKIYFNSEEICSLEEIRLKGRHNLSNVLAAVTMAKIHRVPNKSIQKVLSKFEGLEGRLELIGVVRGIEYINDTTSTIPEACLAALRTFPKRNIILIAGGNDKNLEFKELARGIVKRVKAVILLKGNATDKIKKALDEELNLNNQYLEIIGPLDSMEEAVAKATEQAEEFERSIVLLSPASSSFSMFRHEFERGEAFNKAVSSLK
ncbi:MAG: hypothetical protein AVO34_02105 [Firmicutes bacterium ML8_F2]|jgi:UDP-N-acetylmuramoylalanine--D-glutamate ligase|nr:MAG: hypothetical protein AVO34_02105 [Firmicutes bacterium ML8_F2]